MMNERKRFLSLDADRMVKIIVELRPVSAHFQWQLVCPLNPVYSGFASIARRLAELRVSIRRSP
jgi:hypothetical protein